MAPQRIRAIPEDSRSEASSTKDKQVGAASIPTAVKGRRTAILNGASGSNLRDVTAAPVAATPSNGMTGAPDTAGGINWSGLDTSLLHAYRHAFRLNTPSAFSSPSNHMILSKVGIGRYSPTMAQHKDRRRVSKEHLALAVRKDFNAAVAPEQEIVTAFLYSIRHQDTRFRMRFPPSRPK
ncbi:like protein mitochondrial [Lasallia pustulata]|nr:like protein mitochondrial [Lasallia pustulata]